MGSDKIMPYQGGKIAKFDNFNESNYEQIKVSNRHMQTIIDALSADGISIQSVEEPTYESDGFIELSDTSSISISTDKKMQAVLELSSGTFIKSEETTDLIKVLEDMNNLRLKNRINEADYTTDFKSTEPQLPTQYLKQERAKKVGKALKLMETALQELKHVPKIDWMDDIPDAIQQIEHVLGAPDEYGLRQLFDIYRNEK